MNRLWIACLALVWSLPALQGRAQFFSDDVIEKGTWFISTSLDLRISEGGGQEGFEAQIWPRGGYFFADNWAVSPQVRFIWQTLPIEGNPNEEFKVFRFVTGVSARRYVALSKKLFFHLLLQYNYDGQRFDLVNKESDEVLSSSFFVRHQIFSSFVVMYFVTPRISIESQFGNIQLAYQGFAYDGAGQNVLFRANLLPERAAENFSFIALSYYFGR